MTKGISNRIENIVHMDKSSVWVLTDRKHFNYSDGIASERYLEKVFSHAKDLSSNSQELEGWIKDWPSEYHLSKKRSQLLRGFDFDRSKIVLEVGCGCGAITRFLGETFDEVVSIEGSFNRAKLGRKRTQDLQNVQILCAPFQEIKFKEKFDIIFCIGVFEYSGIYVNADDAYDAILEHFHDMLHEDGVLVLAIENQFGLKYFSSSREDHTNIMFSGIEGYPDNQIKIRTFGYDELKERLNKYFDNIDFYFPYPDYKLPSCILSEKFLSKVKAGELVGNIKSRDYFNESKPLFDENLVYLELDKNNKLPFFSNSFLVIAGKQEIKSIKSQALGILYNTNRTENFQTRTTFTEHADRSIRVNKTLYNGKSKVESDMLSLRSVVGSKWQYGLSLQAILTKRVKGKKPPINDLFTPCHLWLATLKTFSSREGETYFLDGKYVDCIWRNVFINNDKCFFIDQEWEWREKIKLNVIVIRSIYWFLKDISSMVNINPALKKRPTVALIKEIAEAIGVDINKNDFAEFYDLESKISHIVSGLDNLHNWLYIKLPLNNYLFFTLLIHVKNSLKKIALGKDIIANYVYKSILSKLGF